MLVLTTTAYAATTETFYGGYSDLYSKGSIEVDLTNISSQKSVVLSETEAAEYFDDAGTLNMVVDYDYDIGEEVTIKDILANYNNNGGIPTYYADAAPVVVTARTAMRTFWFSWKGDMETTFEPKYYSFDEYLYNIDNKQIYTEQPEDWLLADGTTASLNEPGKYIFVVIDDGLIYNSPAGIFCVHIGDTPSKTPVPEDLSKINANPTTSKVLVNGKDVQFDAYNIGGNNYFKLRDFAQAVNKTEKNFEVTWDEANNAINLISNKAYTPVGGELANGDGKTKVATPTTSKIFKDGKEISLTAYNINGNNYFKLRDLAKAFDIGVTWDGKTNTVGIDTSIGYVEEKVTAVPTSSKILVNGKPVTFEAYNINGNNYFKLRDLAQALSGNDKQFDIAWDNNYQAITLFPGKAYTAVGGELKAGDGNAKTAVLSTARVFVNEIKGNSLDVKAYNINGNNYFKLRDIAQIIDFGVTWDAATQTVSIDTSTSYVPDK